MDLIRSAIRDQLFNQRIGCCLQVIVITWLLWRPIHCNSNRLNGANRRTKSTEQRLNQNGFDPLHRPYPAYNRSESSLYADPYNLNYNYLLSVLQNEERQAIINNVIHHKSVPTFNGEVHENVDPLPDAVPDSVPEVVSDNNVDLSAEDRSGVQDTNKLYSSSLNVIDVSPQDTHIAHSVLIIAKPKPNKTTVKPTLAPQLLFPQTITGIGIISNKSPLVTAIKTPTTTARPTTTTENFGYSMRNNHRPMFLRPFPGKKKTTTTSPTTVWIKSTTAATTIMSSPSTNSVTDSHTTNTTNEFEDSDDSPVVISSNHKKNSFPTMFTRQKLTSTEYALVFTTPESVSQSDKTVFTEVPTLSSITSTPTYTFRPPYMTTLSHKRPPMKIMTVNSNRIRQPEEIYHEGITVLDPPFSSGHSNKLPPNTTILHKNLIVPMKDGRPKPVYPMTSTTQYPIYPVVAGITKWHTSPTTSWAVPIVTTSSPYEYHPFTTTHTSDTTDNIMTEQSANRPIIVTGHPLTQQTQHSPQTHPQTLSSPHTSQPTSHLVTVTPIKSTQSTPTASTFIVTHSSPRPSTSTQGYVNAIWAPPMPVHATNTGNPIRPIHAIQTAPASSFGSWFSPISNMFSYDPATSSMFSFMGVLRTVAFTFLVFFLPPFTLAAALMQAALG